MKIFDIATNQYENEAKMWTAINKRASAMKKNSTAIVNLLKETDGFTYTYKRPDYTTGEECEIDILTKAGAEFLCNLYSIDPVYEVTSQVKPNGDTIFLARCSLSREGEVLGEGRSAQSSMGFSSYNMAQKMSEKSALVAAVLRVFGLSSRLGQDKDESEGKITRADFESQNNKVAPTGVSPDKLARLSLQKGVDISFILTRYNAPSLEHLKESELVEATEMLMSKPDQKPAPVTPIKTAEKKAQVTSEQA